MNKNAVLVLMTIVGSMFSWVLFFNQGLRLPSSFPSVPMVTFAVPVFVVALATGLSTVLSNGFWLAFPVGSFVGTLGGIFAGMVTVADPIAGGLLAFFLPIIAAVTIAASFAAALVGRRLAVTNPPIRRTIWLALISYCALGPVVLLLRK